MIFYESLLRRAYEAFNERDLQIALDTMHADVQWANGMESGTITGRDNVGRYWTEQWKKMDPFVEPESFSVISGQRVSVEVHQTVHDLSGKIISHQKVRHIFSFEDGLIKTMGIEETGHKNNPF